MNLFGGYQGKRVKKNKFQLYKQKKGKRIAQKPNDVFSQSIQIISGKIKYLSNKIKELWNSLNEEEKNYESDSLSDTVELKLNDTFSSNNLSNLSIVNLVIHSLSDVETVISHVEKGNITIANYGLLTALERKEFDSRLSIALMPMGTHLTHISSSEIICARREVSIEDNISNRPKTNGECIAFDKKNEDVLDLFDSSEKSILEEYFSSRSNNTCSIINLTIYSLLDVEKVVSYVEEGYLTIASYRILTPLARKEFDNRLSIALMRLGTHLTHISNSEIICAKREISIEDKISEKKVAKIYELNAMKR